MMKSFFRKIDELLFGLRCLREPRFSASDRGSAPEVLDDKTREQLRETLFADDATRSEYDMNRILRIARKHQVSLWAAAKWYDNSRLTSAQVKAGSKGLSGFFSLTMLPVLAQSIAPLFWGQIIAFILADIVAVLLLVIWIKSKG